MTYKQLEASREARLWLGQIILPIIGIVFMVPESRNAIVEKARNVTKSIETKFNKK